MEDKNTKDLAIDSSLHLNCIEGIRFAPREIDILACVVGGRTAKKIASFLSLSPRTVENYIHIIMQKLACNSRERLIDLVEKSDKMAVIKKHYAHLLLQVEFENNLKETRRLNHPDFHCWLIMEEPKKPLLSFLEKHLTLAGLNVSVKTSKELEILSHNTSTLEDVDYIIFINAAPYREATLKTLTACVKGLLFLSLEEQAYQEHSDTFKRLDNITLIKGKNYYSLALDVLTTLLPQSDSITEGLKKKCEAMNGLQISPPAQHEKTTEKKAIPAYLIKDLKLNKRVLHGLSAIFIIGILSISLLSMSDSQYQRAQGKDSIRSDLILPKEDLLLNRPELIASIDSTLNGQNGIQTVALIGTGGAGKTTLARLYARSQRASLIWEINAETHEGLVNSFENLASALSKTEEDKKILKALQDIKDLSKKENKILSFVKEKIKAFPGWLLIYDNVETFPDIQNYFPRDERTWGQGKVILTTRNHNLQNNKHVNSIVAIEILNHQQKLDLFSKIVNNANATSLSSTQLEKNREFLKAIPSFPLDVSIAAYYLKATNISHKDYLESLERPDQKFIDVQADILKDSSDYVKTRYGIITLSLQQLLSLDKDFAELFLLISLLDSQNIPREILEKHKDKSVVDNFIYNLKKYSLINNSSESFAPSMATFSIHRSTQSISLAYFIKELGLTENSQLMPSIANTLEKYITQAIETEDLLKIKMLLTHYEAILKNDTLLTDNIKRALRRGLGYIYYHLSYPLKAKALFEKNLERLDTGSPTESLYIASSLMYLGCIYNELGQYEKAESFLTKSLNIYRKKFPDHHIDIARGLLYLGYVYEHLGNYEKAKELIEQSFTLYKQYAPEKYVYLTWALAQLGKIYKELGQYEKAKNLLAQGISLCKKHLPKDHIEVARFLAHLGNTYRELGQYEKAKDLLEQSLTLCKKYFPENHVWVTWILMHLGNTYKELGQYEKAKDILKKSLVVYKKNFSEGHIYYAQALAYLGEVYSCLNDYETATFFLNKSLITYEKNYGKGHIETAWVLRGLGQAYLCEGNMEAAEKFFSSSFKIFEQNKHPGLYKCLENLSELYQKKSEQARKAGLTAQAQEFKEQASQNLMQALEIIKAHFLESSPHIFRIQAKIDKLKEWH